MDNDNPWRGLPCPPGRNDDGGEAKSETTSPGSISTGTGEEGDVSSQDVLFAISEAAKAANRSGGSARSLRPPPPQASWREGWSSAPAAAPGSIPGPIGAQPSQGSSSTGGVSHGSEGMYSGPSTEAPERPSSIRFRFSAEPADAGIDEEDDFCASAGLERDESETSAPKIMDLREAIQSRSLVNLEASLKRGSIRRELMAKNAANGAGMLMLAVSMGRVPVLQRVAAAVKQRMGTTHLARQLRYEDDEEKPLIFYATASSLAMFQAVKKLIKDTIGVAGLAEQLRHQCSKGTNVLMRASGDPEVFREVWALLERIRCLRELMNEKDKDGKSWVLYAAEAGNPAVFDKIRLISEDVYTLFSKADRRGWNGFMYTVRRRGAGNLSFLKMLCAACFASRADAAKLEEQLTRVANDEDRSTMLMHASIGGRKAYNFVCSMMSEIEYAGNPDQHDKNLAMLCWAAQGGDITVLNMVAEGIKTRVYPGGTARRRWFDANYHSEHEADTLLNAILTYPERPGTSFFLSAVESGTPAMIKIVAEGIRELVPDPKVRWTVLCGIEGNPLVAAASTTMECFMDTLHSLQAVTELDLSGELKRELMGLLLPTRSAEVTPLVSAAYTEDPGLFTAVLKEVDCYATKSEGGWLSGDTIIEQMGHAMRDVNKEEQLAEKWISAKMLAHVLEAAKTAGKDSADGYFDVSILDDFVRLSVQLGAFDHVRELVNIGCNLANHFPSLLSKIGTYEKNTIDCTMLAITTASNPFVVCGMASKAIYEATIKRQMHNAPLARLQQRIMELTLELLEHLPHSVNGVGEELARGDLDLEPFYAIAKVVPSELLGYVVVGWMFEGSGQSTVPDAIRLDGGENSLVQAVRSGPRSLEFLSEALVLDYLGLKFSRTLPRWHSQKPFERNINQAFYSYTHQARKAPADAAAAQEESDFFQTLLLILQGWRMKHVAIPHRTILPGLQFTLAGIMGKPVSYYIVPSIRMAFVVISYLTTIGLYLSCVSLKSQDIPPNEWIFYVFMVAVAWREILEFSNASQSEPGVGASIDRYFYDKWNFLDVTTVLFVFLAFLFRMMELATGNAGHLIVAQCFLASTAPLLFSRVLFLSQIGSALGPMTQVIFTMLRELAQFSLVLLLVMLGFAASFSALYDTNTVLVQRLDPSCDVSDHPVVQAFGEIGASLLTIFAAMLGEFDFSVFYERYDNGSGIDCGGVVHIEAGVTLMVIYLVIMAVMLLNLLIAVLSTAHSEVQQNASKEFQLARAKIIIQSGEDVLNDVLPPPFNLLKPVLGAVWPVGSRRSEQWDRLWEITMGALNRTIFSFVVGLGALALLNVMWTLSFPLITWKISIWLSTVVPLKRNEEERQADQESAARARTSVERPTWRLKHQQRWSCLTPKGIKIHGIGSKDDDIHFSSSSRESRRLYLQPSSMKGDDVNDSVERIFFLGSSEGKGRLSTAHAAFLLGSMIYLLVGAVLAAVLCFLVYPLLSVVLWGRGLGTVLRYIDQCRSKGTPWERRQLDLDEQEEWSLARAHAIMRNRRYSTANSSETEFNVDALLKTTTGMTLDDLGQSMRNFKSTRKQRALGASLDLALSQFPSEDGR